MGMPLYTTTFSIFENLIPKFAVYTQACYVSNSGNSGRRLEMLTKKDQKKVSKALSQVASKWSEIGKALQLPRSTLDNVEKLYSSEQKLNAVMREWLVLVGSGASWQAVVDALRSSAVRENRLAGELERKYCSGTGTTSSASSASVSTSTSSESSGKQKVEEQSESGLSNFL